MSVALKHDKYESIEDLAIFLSDVIAKESGNMLGEKQRSMVISRIQRRITELKLTPKDYYGYFTQNYKQETEKLVSLLTTHHTFFFREFSHFEYIQENLAQIVKDVKARGENTIKVYSAACSMGQEVYSLSMFLRNCLKAYPDMSYKIVGTDIDPESVQTARNGVYPFKDVKTIPSVYLEGNWQKGTGSIADYAKVKKHIKENCSFKVCNLLNLDSEMSGEMFDIIFCRNVFIYFENNDILKICNNFKKYLYKTGILVTGVSESLKQVAGLEVFTRAPSVYNLFSQTSESLTISEPEVKRPPIATQKNKIPKPIKILCVDDSTSVLKLLTKIFSSDSDFKFMGTALNGLEAEEFVKNNNVDAMTLDIHMPEMNGVEYLRKNHVKTHPKVVMVSSASREDTRYAQKAIRYGASDFVEKPALNNLADRAEEIKMKIKMSFLNDLEMSTMESHRVDDDFKKSFKIKNCNDKSRIIYANFSDRKRLINLLKETKSKDQPNTFLIFEGNANYIDIIKTEFENENLDNVKILEGDEPIEEKNNIYLCDYDTQMQNIINNINNKKVSVCVFGSCSKKAENTILRMNQVQILLEDIEDLNSNLKNVAADIFPWTSFGHLSTEYLAVD